ncbi:MAG: SpoIIE family protein phosphatase [Candidatus Tectimicrobiota bacterium]
MPQHLRLDCGAATRAHPRMGVNGDAFILQQWEAGALVGMIDGLGHGPEAYRAAQTAWKAVTCRAEQPLDVLFQAVGLACRTTHGVVMALARFVLRPALAPSSFVFASIGNIEARLVGSTTPNPLQVCRGILGVHTLTPVSTEHHWESGDILILHSDGVPARWRWQDFVHLTSTSATGTAQYLLQALAREHDDATVVVVKGCERAQHGHG